jgi:Mor family transcriptional regulator
MSSYNPFDDEHPLAYWQSKGESLPHHEKMVARDAAIKWVILESGWKKTRAEMVEIMGIPLTTLDNVYDRLKIRPVLLRKRGARGAYGVRNKPRMTVENAEMIRAELQKGATVKEMAIKYQTSIGTISNIRHNKIYVK